MPNYDFKSLSDYEFELLSRDVLQKREGIQFESFARGRDKGIDLRSTRSLDYSIIAQCKHYAESRFAQLKSNLINIEKPKIEKLAPERYILVTSLALTPTNVDELVKLLSPYVLNSTDIVHRETLNNLLSQFPEIEKNHFKLWLTSVPVLEKILHSEELNYTEMVLEGISERLKKLVHTKAFDRAIEILEQLRYCLITGSPGIGKTTLAELLLFKYIDEGFQPIVIGRSIDQAIKMYKPDIKQIFYYDDFLGAIGATGQFETKEDERLIQFIKRVSKHESKRLILTTRPHILRHAQDLSDAIYSSTEMKKEMMLSLGDYSRFDRAKILYNHLYFSKMPKEYLTAILRKSAYKRIIDHSRYNPRIIEAMTELLSEQQIESDDYLTEFISNLNEPARLWRRMYDKQLKFSEQNLLLTLFSMASPVTTTDLEKAFGRFHMANSNRLGRSMNTHDFASSIKILDGNLLKTTRYAEKLAVDFANPSIKDLINSVLEEDKLLKECLFSNCEFFSQAIALLLLYERSRLARKTERTGEIELLISQLPSLFVKEDALWAKGWKNNTHQLIDIATPERQFMNALPFISSKHKSILESLFSIIKIRILNGSCFKSDAIGIFRILESKNVVPDTTEEFARLKKHVALVGCTDIKHFDFAVTFIDANPTLVSTEEVEILTNQFSDYVNTVDFKNEDDIDELENIECLFNSVGTILNVKIETALEMLSERLQELRDTIEPDHDYYDYRDQAADTDESAIDEMFDTLRE